MYNYDSYDKDDIYILKFESMDNPWIKIKKKELLISKYLKDYFNKADHKSILIKDTTYKIMKQLIYFCKYHWNRPNESYVDMFSKNLYKNISKWDKSFLEDIENLNTKKSKEENISCILMAADKFKINRLKKICSLQLVNMFKNHKQIMEILF
jgi:hypothetical protein